MMRKTLLLTAIALILIFVLSSLAMALPKMFISEQEFNFGFVPQNSKISHMFWIKSVGEDSLIIISVKPG